MGTHLLKSVYDLPSHVFILIQDMLLHLICSGILHYYFHFFILVINQLDKICFTVSLFHASTCFEHRVLIVRRSKLYYTASGIITPIGVMIPEAV